MGPTPPFQRNSWDELFWSALLVEGLYRGGETYEDGWAKVESWCQFYFKFVACDEVFAGFAGGRGDGLEVLGVPGGHVGEVEHLLAASASVQRKFDQKHDRTSSRTRSGGAAISMGAVSAWCIVKRREKAKLCF